MAPPYPAVLRVKVTRSRHAIKYVAGTGDGAFSPGGVADKARCPPGLVRRTVPSAGPRCPASWTSPPTVATEPLLASNAGLSRASGSPGRSPAGGRPHVSDNGAIRAPDHRVVALIPQMHVAVNDRADALPGLRSHPRTYRGVGLHPSALRGTPARFPVGAGIGLARVPRSA